MDKQDTTPLPGFREYVGKWGVIYSGTPPPIFIGVNTVALADYTERTVLVLSRYLEEIVDVRPVVDTSSGLWVSSGDTNTVLRFSGNTLLR